MMAEPFPPPVFSDGTEQHHPKYTGPFKAEKQLNYLKAYDDDEPIRVMWLEKLGDEFARIRDGGTMTQRKRGSEKPSGNFTLSGFPPGYKLYCHIFAPQKRSRMKLDKTKMGTPSKESFICPITKLPARRDTYLYGMYVLFW